MRVIRYNLFLTLYLPFFSHGCAYILIINILFNWEKIIFVSLVRIFVIFFPFFFFFSCRIRHMTLLIVCLATSFVQYKFPFLECWDAHRHSQLFIGLLTVSSLHSSSVPSQSREACTRIRRCYVTVLLFITLKMPLFWVNGYS
jgi:hypothetical protein